MTRTGCAYERPTSAQPTNENESSSSPTPKAPASPSTLPTPMARDRHSPPPANQVPRGRLTGSLPDAVTRLFPTPQASDDLRTGYSPTTRKAGGHQVNLADAVMVFLPTPSASNPNDGEDPTSWLRRQTRHRARGINGNGIGMPLSIAVRLLPTPKAGDTGTSGRKAGQGFRPPLSEQILDLFPNPPTTTAGTLDPHDAENSPAPAVVRLLPTPRTGANRNSRKAATVHRSGPGLEQAIEITLGIRPRELSTQDTPPNTWTTTPPGATTNPPSDGGKPWSDDPHPTPPNPTGTTAQGCHRPSSNG